MTVTCPRRACRLPNRTSPCSSADCALKEHFAPPIDADFYYFKPGGKWKYEREGTWPDFDILRPSHDDILRANRRFPGIVGDGYEFTVVCIPRESCQHPHAFPRIIWAERAKE